MRVSYNWLKRYCDFDLSPEQVVERLTDAGLEVEDVEQRGSDTVLVTEVTTNRPDWLSHIGVARDISVLTGLPLTLPEVDFETSGPEVGELTKVEVLDAQLCPSYTARIITGVKVAPSPGWLVEAIESVGLRPVNNVVDITNFVLFECGQPLHAFDCDKLRERRIVVRRALAGEKFSAIDGSIHELRDDMLVIADAKVPVAVAGVMGGLATEVSNSTTTVFLESARFAPVNIRQTSRLLGLASDSSYRFERGTDPQGADWASRRAAQLIAEVCGGKIAPGVIDVSVPADEPTVVSLRPSRFERIMGIGIEPERARDILVGLGLVCISESVEKLTFRVPSWRSDITREADLIEEVARIHGYGKIPALPNIRLAVREPDRFSLVGAGAAGVLTAAGYSETVTWSLIDEDNCRAFHPFSSDSAIRINNPLGADVNHMRMSMISGLLKVRKHNQDRRNRDVRLFEIASVYLPTKKPGEQPEEKMVLAIISDDDFLGVKGVVEAIAAALRVSDRLSFAPGGPGFVDADCSAQVTLDGEPLGYMGKLTDAARARFDLKTAVTVAELDFAMLEAAANLEPKYTPLPRFPETTRDLAVVVDEAVSWSQVEQTVQEAAPEILEEVNFLSEFRGEQIPSEKKCLAFGMTFRAPDRTLTSEEADTAQESILAALREKLSATLRAK